MSKIYKLDEFVDKMIFILHNIFIIDTESIIQAILIIVCRIPWSEIGFCECVQDQHQLLVLM